MLVFLNRSYPYKIVLALAITSSYNTVKLTEALTDCQTQTEALCPPGISVFQFTCQTHNNKYQGWKENH